MPKEAQHLAGYRGVLGVGGEAGLVQRHAVDVVVPLADRPAQGWVGRYEQGRFASPNSRCFLATNGRYPTLSI